MGYRLRMTLAFGLLALASVVFLTALFLWSSYREFRADRIEMIGRMSECLAGNVYWDMRALDPARVEDSLGRFVRGLAGAGPVTIAVLDADGRLYGTTAEAWRARPGAQASALDPAYGPLLERLPPTRTSVTLEEKYRFLTGTTSWASSRVGWRRWSRACARSASWSKKCCAPSAWPRWARWQRASPTRSTTRSAAC